MRYGRLKNWDIFLAGLRIGTAKPSRSPLRRHARATSRLALTTFATDAFDVPPGAILTSTRLIYFDAMRYLTINRSMSS